MVIASPTTLSERLQLVALDRALLGIQIAVIAMATALVISEPLGIPLSAPLVLANVLLIGGLIALYGVARAGRLPPRLSHAALAAVCLAGPIGSIVAAYLARQPTLAAPLMLGILAMSFQLDARWCPGSILATLAAWLPLQFDATPVDLTTMASVVGTGFVSMMLHLGARRWVIQAERSRLEAEEAAARLRTELDDRLRAEAERESLRDQFVHAQRMEAVGTLAAGLAHDMKNILAGILGMSELLRADAKDPAQRADLDAVCAEAARGAALTQSLLSFSRRGQYRQDVLRLDAVVDQIVPLLRRTLPKTIELDRRGVTAIAIDGDLAQLGQVIINLCLNGADAMVGQGRMTIETGSESLASATAAQLGLAPGTYGTLTVVDTGGGMDPATQAKIFEPFFTTKAAGKGTGLGLAMVIGAVKAHRGAISVDSEVGVGTRFRIYLPVSVSASASPSAAAVERHPELRGLVMVVDDEALVRKAATRVLARAGLDVVNAADGAEAVRIFAARHREISMVLLDLSMPTMGGTECFHRLRAIAPVPTLIASGNLVEAEARALLDSGAAGFLDKPYSASELLDQVTAIVGADPSERLLC